jgi:hypothetical protein
MNPGHIPLLDGGGFFGYVADLFYLYRRSGVTMVIQGFVAFLMQLFAFSHKFKQNAMRHTFNFIILV